MVDCSTCMCWSMIIPISRYLMRPLKNSSASSTTLIGTSMTVPCAMTKRSTLMCWATSSRNTSTRSRWVPTIPKRILPNTSARTPSFPTSLRQPNKNVSLPSMQMARSGHCCEITLIATSMMPSRKDANNRFREILKQVEQHPSRRYFIFKSIIVNNLYGVDIMEEATEICKLRLFLKLVSQVKKFDDIEPQPDIDFNIRAGNTLVGFASLEEVGKAISRDLRTAMTSTDALARIEQKAQ